ncbi:MAG: propionate kinase [Hafnia paralvei]|jgi:propionate kinase|uniref:propionate kinase n=1 Tax=Hafnia paralvei TaxID=546367 RepID=UPI0015844E08|nr:propionate kinase [Hafnia paralvei]MCE9881477.1 propionate kinase [Hafnia paralvei]MCE9908745.1 propionate kinase [Hafnia paralvei]NUN42693.1 propionate kinase [Hafnia paralvei]
MSSKSVVLVINCGSSSIKFSVMQGNNCDVMMSGIVDNVGIENTSMTIDKTISINLKTGSYEDALNSIVRELEKRKLSEAISCVGHRIAHGGEAFSDATLINDEVLEEITNVSSLAPLHNYANLEGIMAARHIFPDLLHVAVFDTAFHQSLKPEAYTYALPQQYFKKYGVRRYGFHGTSHRYVAQQAIEQLGLDENNSGIIVAHLGNGASICAVQNGKSVDTSMGMTPLEGLVMGTRSGDVDFGALAYLADKTGKTLDDLMFMVNKESGLLGISGLSSDLRVLQKAYEEGHEGAQLAINVFVHRLARHIGGHAASLTKLDALIFTGGIGENSELIRKLTLDHLAVFGLKIDDVKNHIRRTDDAEIVTSSSSKVIAAVIPTNEEKMIALDAMRVSSTAENIAFA